MLDKYSKDMREENSFKPKYDTVNKVILLGRLGTELREYHTPHGNKVYILNVATHQSHINPEKGQAYTYTEWHEVTLFEPEAKYVLEKLKKGVRVYIEAFFRSITDEQKKEQKADYNKDEKIRRAKTITIIAKYIHVIESEDHKEAAKKNHENTFKKRPSPTKGYVKEKVAPKATEVTESEVDW